MRVQSWRSVASVLFLFPFALALCFGSYALPEGDGPGSNPFPTNDNQWHLGYSARSFSSNSAFAEVANTGMGDQDAGHPMEVAKVYADTTNKIVLATPPTDCANGGPPQTNACTFTTSIATQEDDHHIRYTFRNWGGRCNIWLRVNVYAPTAVWKWADLTPWSGGSTFIVVVPEGGTSPEVFGKLRGVNIFLTPSDPLSDSDAQNFTLLDHAKVVPGLGTIYRFMAK